MGFLDRLLGRQKPAPPKIVPRRNIGQGHRGIAAGDLKRRHEQAERYLETRDPSDRPWTEDEISRWEMLPAEEVHSFIYEDKALVVHSTNVKQARYYPHRQKMMIEYHNGSAYLYDGVSVDEAISFANAQSKGGWVWDHLRIRGSRTGHKKSYVRLIRA